MSSRWRWRRKDTQWEKGRKKSEEKNKTETKTDRRGETGATTEGGEEEISSSSTGVGASQCSRFGKHREKERLALVFVEEQKLY